MIAAADPLLVELRALVERLPLPHPLWHRHVPQMHQIVVDATAALETISQLPQARAELRRQVEGDADYPADDALEAAEAALAALAEVEGDGAFAEAARRLPVVSVDAVSGTPGGGRAS